MYTKEEEEETAHITRLTNQASQPNLSISTMRVSLTHDKLSQLLRMLVGRNSLFFCLFIWLV
jgi:hypothetical protein